MYQTSEDKESNTVGTAGAHVEDSEIGKYIELSALFGKPLNSCLFQHIL